MSEVEKFLQEISDGGDAFSETTTPAEVVENTTEEKVEEIIPFHKDERFKKSREEVRALRQEKDEWLKEKERLLAQTQNNNVSVPSDFESDWVKTYGDSDESKAQLNFFAKYLNGLDERAAAKAMEKFKAESEAQKSQSQQEEERWNNQVQSQLEAVEDEFGIDLTSSQAASKRTEFLSFLQDISPKDSDGNIIQYVPMDKAYPLWVKQNTKDNTERKEIANRSMDKTNTETPKTYKPIDFRNTSWKDWAKQNGEL